MLFHKTPPLDGKPTMAEWPVRIWAEDEIKDEFRPQVRRWTQGKLDDYQFVYAPKRSTVPDSFAYLFGYGMDRLLYLRQVSDSVEPTELCRGQIQKIDLERNLLNVELVIHCEEQSRPESLRLHFPYIASVYYLYDPFLNWLLGLPCDFMPLQAERESPRPEKLYHESLALYNFSLDAYRLGGGFTEYKYRKETYRNKWMPWKLNSREWLEIPMERGTFKLYHDGYCRKYQYCEIQGRI